jgi:hypothetical protein
MVSRSYRKPVAKDGYGSKWKKKADEVADGGSYRKEYNSWDICDFKFEITQGPDKKNRRK